MIEPFNLAIEEDQLQQLQQKLASVRWPDQITIPETGDWTGGVPVSYMQKIHKYWENSFDWRKQEQAFNGFAHFTTEIAARRLHFIHEKSSNAGAIPVCITHGWPGSVLEFKYLIRRLTQPEEFGVTGAPSFDVVCPSIPGYALSQASSKPGLTISAIADINAQLMQLLGYDKYMVQGGDWGSIISSATARRHSEQVLGLHLNMAFALPPGDVADPLSLIEAHEKEDMQNMQIWQGEGNGYFRIQATKPNTLGFGLTDSPIGLAAWIIEKFHAWSDCNGDPQNALAIDDMLTNICLYWFSGNITSAARLYFEAEHDAQTDFSYVDTPTAAAIFPVEIGNSPKAWAERAYNIQRWTRYPKGGHFAALEQPDFLAEDLRAFALTLTDNLPK